MDQKPTDRKPEESSNGRRERELEIVREALSDLRFGSLTVIVQDGVIVQIDRLEKKRLQLSPGQGG